MASPQLLINYTLSEYKSKASGACHAYCTGASYLALCHHMPVSVFWPCFGAEIRDAGTNFMQDRIKPFQNM